MADTNSTLSLVYPKNRKFRNLLGQRYGKLLIIQFAGQNKFKKSLWLCACACGTPCTYVGASILNGRITTCGCSKHYANFRHGQCTDAMKEMTPEIRAFYQAKQRCINPNLPEWDNYGGRGIEFRFNTFDEFFAELGKRPSAQHSIDRYPDNNGHYETGNVRWATRVEQQRNKRNNIFITFQDKRLTAHEWSDITGINVATIYIRKSRGWCDECCVTLPARFTGGQIRCPHILTPTPLEIRKNV